MLKIVENLWVVGAPPRTPLGSSQRYPRPYSWWAGGCCPSRTTPPWVLAPSKKAWAHPCQQSDFLLKVLYGCLTLAFPQTGNYTKFTAKLVIVRCDRQLGPHSVNFSFMVVNILLLRLFSAPRLLRPAQLPLTQRYACQLLHYI